MALTLAGAVVKRPGLVGAAAPCICGILAAVLYGFVSSSCPGSSVAALATESVSALTADTGRAPGIEESAVFTTFGKYLFFEVVRSSVVDATKRPAVIRIPRSFRRAAGRAPDPHRRPTRDELDG